MQREAIFLLLAPLNSSGSLFAGLGIYWESESAEIIFWFKFAHQTPWWLFMSNVKALLPPCTSATFCCSRSWRRNTLFTLSWLPCWYYVRNPTRIKSTPMCKKIQFSSTKFALFCTQEWTILVGKVHYITLPSHTTTYIPSSSVVHSLLSTPTT